MKNQYRGGIAQKGEVRFQIVWEVSLIHKNHNGPDQSD